MTVGAWHVGEVFLSMLWFVLFFVWLWLAISVFIDIFRSHDLSGPAKALWVLFIVVLPYLGVFVYLIARGGTMHERSVKAVQQADDQFKAYVQSVAGTTPSPAAEIERLEGLRARGVITDDEFAQLKAKVMSGAS
ncbi:MAG TPA: SHOCT domain-containing protein [Acidimicrobiia bacterium]|nr:SHOCT domain-containing protein [Acidimicrobiia bacterium]